MVKGSSMCMGVKALGSDMNVIIGPIDVNTDASAAKGIASRRGLGKIRHIELSQLWLQDRVSRGELTIRKYERMTV
jgi:hypothetical protein